MSDRGSKTLLTVSLLGNAFLAAALVSGVVYVNMAMGERASLHPKTPLATIARDIDPAVRAQLEQKMRAAGLSAAPDFQAARAARKRAADLASQPNFDRTAAQAAIDEALVDEQHGRTKVESALLDFLQTQNQQTRVTLSRALAVHASLRMGPRGPHGGPHGGPGGLMPPPDAPPPPQH
jgi:uncharacterized membrane protein